MLREIEWTVGAILVALVAAILLVSAAVFGDGPLQTAAFLGAWMLAAAAAVVANVWGYVVPRDGYRRRREGRLERAYHDLETRDSLLGVTALWFLAAVSAVLTGIDPGNRLLLWVGVAGLIVSVVAFVWGDMVMVGSREGPRTGRTT